MELSSSLYRRKYQSRAGCDRNMPPLSSPKYQSRKLSRIEMTSTLQGTVGSHSLGITLVMRKPEIAEGPIVGVLCLRSKLSASREVCGGCG
jgi:hypothetical protein